MRRLTILTLVSGAILSLAAVGHADPRNSVRPAGSGSSRGRLIVGSAPPPLALDRISGSEQVTLDGLAGRVVLLDFWATWCSPCRALMPVLDSMYQQHRGSGLSVVGLSPEPDAMIRRHMSRQPVQYTIARDVGGTARSYGVRGIPTIVVLDRRGQVRDVVVGVDGPAIRRLDSLVQRLLAEPAP